MIKKVIKHFANKNVTLWCDFEGEFFAEVQQGVKIFGYPQKLAELGSLERFQCHFEEILEEHYSQQGRALDAVADCGVSWGYQLEDIAKHFGISYLREYGPSVKNLVEIGRSRLEDAEDLSETYAFGGVVERYYLDNNYYVGDSDEEYHYLGACRAVSNNIVAARLHIENGMEPAEALELAKSIE